MIRNSLVLGGMTLTEQPLQQKQGVVSTTPAAAVAALAGFAAVAAKIGLSADGASALSAGYVKLSGGSDATKAEAGFGIPATNAFTVRAKNAGVVTQDFDVVVAGNNTPESLVVTPGSIVFNAATDASGAAVSNPQNVQNRILGHAGAYAVMDIGGGVLPGRVLYVANAVGFGGNAIEVWHKAGAAESCTVLGTIISVTLNSGVSTSATIAALVNATPEAAALVTASPVEELVDDEVGAINLAGGVDAVPSTVTIGGGVSPGKVTYTAVTAGVAGDLITVHHAAGVAEACNVVGTDITVTLNSGTSTAASIAALIALTPAAAALVTALVDTVGLVDDEAAPINLAGGVDIETATKDIGGLVLPGIVSYTAITPGAAGNAITVWHKAGVAEAISVAGTDITITLNSGVSTATSIAALVNADPSASALVAAVGLWSTVDDEAAAIALTGGITPASDIVEIDDLDGTSPVADEGPTALTGGAAAVAASGSLGVSGTNGLDVTAVTPGAAGNDIEVQIINIAGQSLNMILEGTNSIKIIPAAA